MEAGSDECVEAVSAVLVELTGGELDEDTLPYVASMVAEEPTSTAEDFVDTVGAFLESAGVADDDEHALKLCQQLVVALKKAGVVAGGDDSAVVAPDAGSGGGTGGAGATELPKLLGTPVTLGHDSGKDDMVDFMWGKESNAYLNANTTFEDGSELGNSKANAKKAARKKAREERSERVSAAAALTAIDEDDGAVVMTGESTGRMRDIFVPNFTIGYPGRILFEDASLKLVMGRRYALVGRNGMGKTTLLRNIAGSELYGFPTDISVMHVEQEIKGTTKNVLGVVLATDTKREALLAEAADLEKEPELGADGKPITKTAAEEERDVERLRDVYTELEEIDAHTAEARASSILTGLGFNAEMLEGKTADLSGGWRMRVSLACALFAKPDLLLLDEPTNHLDFPAVMWLTDYLVNHWDATVLVVSHDRDFLNDIATDVVHLDNKKLVYYRGDFDTFEESRAERRRHQEKAIESAEARRKHMQLFVDRFRYNAKRASLVQSRIKALNRMESLDEVVDDPTWAFSFPDPGEISRPVLSVVDMGFAYEGSDNRLFKDVDFGLDTDSRVAILGPNGAGKSTLLNLLLGKLVPTEGHVTRNGKLRIAAFTQHHVEQLDVRMNALEHVQFLFPDAKKDAVRSQLGRFGITGDLALNKMATLSGGQKSRVAFAVMTWKKPHVVVLDEPTNHLDLDTIDALVVALGAFNGGVVIVSHDQHFVNSVADEIWYVADKGVARFEGTLAEYKAKMLAAAAK